MVVANRHVLASRAEIHAPNIVQGRLGGGPVGEHGRRRYMQKLHTILLTTGGHGKDLAVVVKLTVISGRLEVHDGLDWISFGTERSS